MYERLAVCSLLGIMCHSSNSHTQTVIASRGSAGLKLPMPGWLCLVLLWLKAIDPCCVRMNGQVNSQDGWSDIG